ncbi:hypothetical protein SAMN05444148_1458 [Winogradskyella jejuensis]|uniref:Uncharacterized protein n=1 Tax=Winogradskyella jejuensis TaxID=1089305 RepID=A0A1M5PDV3_9FLAO|nr:hypothetical protein SAMN05444148_1458 [Winogradskyella jejuensis]
MKIPLYLVLICFCLQGFSQQEFFSEAILKNTIISKKTWKFNLISNYKHAYQNSKWRRFGLDFDFNKKLNSN